MYLHAESSLEAVAGSVHAGSVADNLLIAYETLLKINVVERKEMGVLKEWLKLF
jgi:hypothetical protein